MAKNVELLVSRRKQIDDLQDKVDDMEKAMNEQVEIVRKAKEMKAKLDNIRRNVKGTENAWLVEGI